MILIAKYTGDYHGLDRFGKSFVIPDIEREVYYDEEENRDVIYLPSKESEKIAEFLEQRYLD